MLRIRLFGMLKILVPGGNEVNVALPSGTQVKELADVLQQQYPELGNLLLQKKVLVSVNQEIAHWETALHEQDEIALLPPFAGGAEKCDEPRKVTYGR